ncbi:MAG: sulfite exporter TauE/SafE family protein [Acidobacteria bacterium]|nr:sulfite exporter TauE/SafE family protein [Acidobacteriota bacterium]MDW7983636.1 sulfite exporter TauE/SafE family protein [Acidobacteriota bacterium]
MDWMYSWTGLAVGLLMGLTGIGADSIMTPLLIVVFGLPPTVAVHLSLVYASVTKVFGAWAHTRSGNVDLPLIRRMAVGSVPGVLLGSALVAYGAIAHPERVQGLLRHGIGWALLLASVTIVSRPWWQGRVTAAWIRTQAARWWLWPFVCFGAGMLVGVTSIGSGSMFTPLLAHGTSLPSRRIVGTVLVHALLITAAGAAFHSWVTPLDGRALGLILIGSIPGILLGSRLTLHVPEEVLRGLVGGALLIAGLRMV